MPITPPAHAGSSAAALPLMMTCTESRPADLSIKLTNQYKVIAEYMRNNKLKLNDDKTHLIVMDTGQSRVRNQASRLDKIRTATETIRPSSRGNFWDVW